MTGIELKNISMEYGKKNKILALRNINIKINKGEMIAIIGPSGSGKSTLLNIIGCLNNSTLGNYIFENESVENFSEKKLANIRNEKFGFVLQYFGLIDEYNVIENVKLPLVYSKKNHKDKNKKILEMLKLLKIDDKAKEYPINLSGGQMQRVALARALINDAEYILADEPTGALDQKTGNEIMEHLERLKLRGKTIIIVTHNDEIANRADRIIKLIDGKIV